MICWHSAATNAWHDVSASSHIFSFVEDYVVLNMQCKVAARYQGQHSIKISCTLILQDRTMRAESFDR